MQLARNVSQCDDNLGDVSLTGVMVGHSDVTQYDVKLCDVSQCD